MLGPLDWWEVITVPRENIVLGVEKSTELRFLKVLLSKCRVVSPTSKCRVMEVLPLPSASCYSSILCADALAGCDLMTNRCLCNSGQGLS